jgi:flagellar protein FliS
MNPYDAKRAYTESSILTAPPERLVVMLYDGAIRFLGQAAVAMRADNQRVFLDRVQRAEAIIKELREAWQQVAANPPAAVAAA